MLSAQRANWTFGLEALDPSAQKLRLPHAQVAAKFAALGAVAVTNPLHLLDDRAAMLQRLGPERSAAGRAFAFRTLQQVKRPLIPGAPVAGHTVVNRTTWSSLEAASCGARLCFPSHRSAASEVTGAQVFAQPF